jgi:hypothetical protein
MLPDGTLTFLVADAWKGIGAALYMTSAVSSTASTQSPSLGRSKNLHGRGALLHVISLTNNYVADTHGEANMFTSVHRHSRSEGGSSYQWR